MSDVRFRTSQALEEELRQDGYVRISGNDMLGHLGISENDWDEFSDSWNDLGTDGYMADGGRYRRRRHAVFSCLDGKFTRKPNQPHYQSRDYNSLNGDVQRWFDPVLPETEINPACIAIMQFCASVFAKDLRLRWHVEMHQFRIEAHIGENGRPTPEGMHRDGVDHVCVMLINRTNVHEGITHIGTDQGTPIGQFMLKSPGDTVLIDDHRIRHGVTEIHPDNPNLPSWRDALVITFSVEA